MDFIFEILFELALEGTIELSKNIKVPKYIRFPALILIILFFMAVIALMIIFGIVFLKDDLFFGVLMIGLGVFFLIGIIVKFYGYCRKRKSERSA